MASAQIYRFQQRITNLQLHHELASVRHCEAVSNYINQNNELMNALMAHLKAPDKGMKRTKRLTKPRTTTTTTTPHTTQLAKSARFTGKSYATQSSHVEQLTTTHHHPHQHQHHHHSLGKKTDFVNQQCLPEDAWNNNSNNNYHHYSYYTTTPVIHNDDHFTCNSKEPIFPPPTYLESSFNCESNRLDNTADENCLWKDIWHENPRNTGNNSSSSSNSSSNNPNVFFQKNHASRTLQTNYTLCDKLFPHNDDDHDDGTQSFMYNNNNIDAQEKHQPQYCWSRDNVSLDDHSKQHILNRSILPDYHLPVITQQHQSSSSSDSYWLKQSTSYTDELKSPIIPFNRNEYFHYSEPLLCAVQNNIDSKHGNCVPINQMTNNNHYSTEFSTFNSSYELTGLSKSHINPILASTYPSIGSGGHSSRSTMFFNTDQSLKPYYDCQSYHPSGNNGDNNVGSSSSSSSNNNDNRSTSNYCIYQTNRP